MERIVSANIGVISSFPCIQTHKSLSLVFQPVLLWGTLYPMYRTDNHLVPYELAYRYYLEFNTPKINLKVDLFKKLRKKWYFILVAKQNALYLHHKQDERAYSRKLKQVIMKKFSAIYFGLSLLAMCCESEYLWWYLLVGANLIVSFFLFKKNNKEYVL